MLQSADVPRAEPQVTAIIPANNSAVAPPPYQEAPVTVFPRDVKDISDMEPTSLDVLGKYPSYVWVPAPLRSYANEVPTLLKSSLHDHADSS